jgi:hypothetical protein
MCNANQSVKLQKLKVQVLNGTALGEIMGYKSPSKNELGSTFLLSHSIDKIK